MSEVRTTEKERAGDTLLEIHQQVSMSRGSAGERRSESRTTDTPSGSLGEKMLEGNRGDHWSPEIGLRHLEQRKLQARREREKRQAKNK